MTSTSLWCRQVVVMRYLSVWYSQKHVTDRGFPAIEQNKKPQKKNSLELET
jgi:hypothetical protein